MKYKFHTRNCFHCTDCSRILIKLCFTYWTPIDSITFSNLLKIKVHPISLHKSSVDLERTRNQTNKIDHQDFHPIPTTTDGRTACEKSIPVFPALDQCSNCFSKKIHQTEFRSGITWVMIGIKIPTHPHHPDQYLPRFPFQILLTGSKQTLPPTKKRLG